MKKYVGYFRVSTAKQGVSGLGLEAQKQAVTDFLKCKNDNCLVASFTEVESGKKNKRVELLKALAYCKENKCTLVVAKLDRLSRDVEFIFNLKNSNVDFLVCDMPELNTLTLGVIASVAQHERELISSRTKASLGALKARGKVLGNPKNLTEKARLKGVESIKTKASENENNTRAKAFINALKSENLTLRQIAEKLRVAGFKTAKGKDFTATQVMRLQK